VKFVFCSCAACVHYAKLDNFTNQIALARKLGQMLKDKPVNPKCFGVCLCDYPILHVDTCLRYKRMEDC